MRSIITIILLIKLLMNINNAIAHDSEFILKCEDVIYSQNHTDELPETAFRLNCGDNHTNFNTTKTPDKFTINEGNRLAYDEFLSKCKISPHITKHQDTELWGITNNLIHNANNPENADTHVLIIQGRVLDANCVPVSDATIRIMEPNLMSKRVNYKKLTQDNNKNLLLAKESTGTATAITNNLGLFTLITQIPSLGKLPSSINLIILHPDFSNHYQLITNNSKNVYRLDALYPELKIDRYIPLYRLDITLNELNKYRTF